MGNSRSRSNTDADTEKADDASALADKPVQDENDPRVENRTNARDELAATVAVTDPPAPEPDDEHVADPDEPVVQGPMEFRTPPWKVLTVPAGEGDEAELTITEEWTRIEAADINRVGRAARSVGIELRGRDVAAASK